MLQRRADRTLVIAATVLCIGGLGPFAAGQSARAPTRVLLIFQQQAETRPMMEFTQRLRVTVESELPLSVEFYQESLDLDRFRGGDRLSDLQAYFEQKYRGFGIDVLVPVGSRALKFAVEQLGDVFPGTPVVFALTAPPATDPAMLPRNVTGRVGITSRFAPTIEMARRLQPDAKQLVIVGGATAQDSSSVAA
ncbi:MAG TPA: hypothetical protein VJN70_01990, partial [Gemmatimonadaceae bacterium]|nr:hypothetical protein [Gemmatimonadaceae bacterium]